MRRTTLNKQDTPKALRLALFVITMLLLPSAAWGEVTYTSTFQIGQSGSSNECMAKETTDNFSLQTIFPIIGNQTLGFHRETISLLMQTQAILWYPLIVSSEV